MGPARVAGKRLVAVAVESPAVRHAVCSALTSSAQYETCLIAREAIECGDWPDGRYSAIVASARAVRAYRSRRGDQRNQWPVVVVLSQAQLARERHAIAASDAFVLTERIAGLLPSIVALSPHRLSVMPVRPAPKSGDGQRDEGAREHGRARRSRRPGMPRGGQAAAAQTLRQRVGPPSRRLLDLLALSGQALAGAGRASGFGLDAAVPTRMPRRKG